MNNQNKPAKQQQVTTSAQVGIQQTLVKGEIFQSNYPPPEMLQKYAEVDPTFPDRLLRMAEKEGNHRRKMGGFLAAASLILDFLGMAFALAGVGGILYVGWLFMEKGHSGNGTTIICTVTVALAIAFISRGRRHRGK